MIEVKQSHLPMLAWRWQNGRYVLIHDDLPVGELRIDPNGRGTARYHDSRWSFDRLDPGRYLIRDENAGTTIADLKLKSTGEAEEGSVQLDGKSYRYVRDPHKIPPMMSITGSEGQPLLQYREEIEDRGKIQIDSLPAAGSPDFDLLTFSGLYLYLSESPTLQVSQTRAYPSRRSQAMRPQPFPPKLQRTAPPPPAEAKGEGGGDGEPWGSWLLSLLAVAVLWTAWHFKFETKRR